MHFRVQTDEINYGLGMVIRAISARPVKQVYDGVLIETMDDGLVLTCTDGEISIKAQVSALVEEDGCALKERIQSRRGLRQLTYMQEMGMGSMNYTLIDVDNDDAEIEPVDAVAHVVPFEG